MNQKADDDDAVREWSLKVVSLIVCALITNKHRLIQA